MGVMLALNLSEISLQFKNCYLVGDISKLNFIFNKILLEVLKYSEISGLITFVAIIISKYDVSEEKHKNMMRIQIGYKKVRLIG